MVEQSVDHTTLCLSIFWGFLSPLGAAAGSELEIDEDENPGADGNLKKIEAEILTFEFSEPFETTRKGRKGEQDENDLPPSDKATVSVSTDEATVQGALPSADFDGIEDKSDDLYLYARRFDAFYRMVDKLLTMPDCELVTAKLRRLPVLKRCTRHLLSWEPSLYCVSSSAKERSAVCLTGGRYFR
ncbi:hypothetical protein [Photorhabdus temperata]|uniref:hypothetical protein n=1 Tax=Photorhabdus temperata TaxID=574560 RepID=UPI0012DD3CD3|nr:hypothetical protein [Photorhabdus temperata]